VLQQLKNSDIQKRRFSRGDPRGILLNTEKVPPMANATHRFKDRDIKRIVRSVREAGEVPRRIEVDPHTGKVTVTVGMATPADTPEDLEKLV
jgi:hypothetical protein